VQAERQTEFDVLHERLRKIASQVERLMDTGADSLDLVELAMELEEAGITVEDLKAGNVQTLEDLGRYLEEHHIE